MKGVPSAHRGEVGVELAVGHVGLPASGELGEPQPITTTATLSARIRSIDTGLPLATGKRPERLATHLNLRRWGLFGVCGVYARACARCEMTLTCP